MRQLGGLIRQQTLEDEKIQLLQLLSESWVDGVRTAEVFSEDIQPLYFSAAGVVNRLSSPLSESSVLISGLRKESDRTTFQRLDFTISTIFCNCAVGKTPTREFNEIPQENQMKPHSPFSRTILG